MYPLLFVLLFLAAAVAAPPQERALEVAALVPTRGAAGWSHFQINGLDYLAVANFFTSSPGRDARMETDSVLYLVQVADRLSLREVQRFPTIGAHGVHHFVKDDHTYLVFPSYYGKRTDVFRWSQEGRGEFRLLQTIQSDGAGSVECFKIDAGQRAILGIAEFNVGVAALYELRGEYPEEHFEPWQRLEAPGVGAIATMKVDGDKLLLLAASCE